MLRGDNLNPGVEPEDMVSIRIWIDEHRVISTRYRRLMAVEDIRAQLAAGKGPVSTGHMVARLAASMTERMSPTIESLSDLVVNLEDQLIGSDAGEPVTLRELRNELIDCRRAAIALRRYINPQRDALVRLSHLDEHGLMIGFKGVCVKPLTASHASQRNWMRCGSDPRSYKMNW